MTEEEARVWIATRHGEARTDRVARFLAMVAEENGRQNLISPSTLPVIWDRHGVDSAQLLQFAPDTAAHWLDIGTGGGFPGIVIALLFEGTVALVEPRRKRAEFLQHCVDALGITNAVVMASKVETVSGRYDIISARAVATVEKLLQAAAHCATPSTRWILPRGRLDPDQLTILRRDHQRLFHVEHSLTDPQSSILIVDPRGAPVR